MKAMINRKTYNTETAQKLTTVYEGTFGDPAGYEESLYQTKKGCYFFHGLGGSDSKYPEETLQPASDAEAKAWLKIHG